LQQISTFVPNVNIRVEPRPSRHPHPRLRHGHHQQAFEQSVGLVVDGIPYNRVSYYGAGVFDLEPHRGAARAAGDALREKHHRWAPQH